MEGKPRKGNIPYRASERKGRRHTQFAGALGLVFALFVKLYSQDANLPEVCLWMEKPLPLVFETGLGTRFSFELAKIPFSAKLALSYQNLGSFSFANGEGLAYSETEVVNASAAKIYYGLSARFGEWSVGIIGDYTGGAVGDNPLSDFSFLADLDWQSPFGRIGLKTGYQNSAFFLSLTYTAELHFFFLHLQPTGSLRYSGNPVLSAGFSVLSYNRELSLGVEYEYGFLYPLYKGFTFSLSRRFEDFGITFSFSPSFLGDSLFNLSLSYSLSEFFSPLTNL